MINLKTTISKGYIVVQPGTLQNNNINGILKMIKIAEKNNVLLSQKLINSLLTIDKHSFEEIKHQFISQYKKISGQFFRSVFATGSDIDDEYFTFEDFIKQISHYYISYGLGEIDYEAFDIDEKRKVQVDNISTKKEKKEINNSFKIINVKSEIEFVSDVTQIITMPIVFGAQQKEFIQEAFDNNLLMPLIMA